MRIAFGIVSLFPSGGLQRDCLEIAKLVRNRGHDVTIFAERASDDLQLDGIAVVTLPNGAATNHHRQYQFAVDFLREASSGFDLTVGFNKLLGLDVLYCADASMRDRLLKQPYLRLLSRYRKYAGIEGDSFEPRHKTKTILLSRNQLLQYWTAWNTESRRMYLLPPTLAASRRRPEYRSDGTRERLRAVLGLSETDWTWMTVAVQPKTKGTDRVIRALVRHPGATLLIAGLRESDKAAAAMLALARETGVASRIRWLGHREDMAELMSAADLLLHPSRYDTTGTVILEAIVNGLPVIATAACGYASHVEDAGVGLVVREPFDQAAFAAAIATAARAETRAQWSQAGIRYGQKAGLSEGRACAARIILAAAHEKHPTLDSAGVGLVPSGNEIDLATLQPERDRDWADYFGTATRAAS